MSGSNVALIFWRLLKKYCPIVSIDITKTQKIETLYRIKEGLDLPCEPNSPKLNRKNKMAVINSIPDSLEITSKIGGILNNRKQIIVVLIINIKKLKNLKVLDFFAFN
ncbi:hypothetical protein [Cyclobacterium qasimii]|uniref:Uncharacterized protein n=2 Tax=Cyclobacterium qasimii TaxID=1350429 RepID=A0A512C6Q1_9BACT|nr:hypothetical protein [Cyclobacterium qasimii]GEO19884.1 hypothetical protein CQA01_04180 [Cyclobacterium qasimii]